MADYYELLGVDSDSSVDDIRTAYRDKKAAFDGLDTADAKGDAAKLNKAWNVLSDPYQRGRYDQQLADADPDAISDDLDDDLDDAPARKPAKSNSRARNRAEARAPLVPTVTLPAGMGLPARRRRLTAMFIDLAMLVVLFVVSQFLTVSLEKSQHAEVYKRATELSQTVIPDAQKVVTAAKKKVSAAEKANASAATLKPLNDAVTNAKAKVDNLNDELTAKQKVLAPLQNLISGIFFLVSLFVLLIPSLFGGQTFGKRQQGIRVVRMDGSPARAGDLFKRYGALVFVAFGLSFLLRSPVGALIIVFVSTLWTRNPNQQGLQDRFAKTLVVTDEE